MQSKLTLEAPATTNLSIFEPPGCCLVAKSAIVSNALTAACTDEKEGGVYLAKWSVSGEVECVW